MKVFDLIDDEPVTVKGAPGKDKVPAVVPAGSFVVPKENTPVAVKLTAGETVIPPIQVPAIDAKAKQAGYGGIQDLAPESRYVEARVADPKTGVITKKLVPREKDLTKSMQEMQGMTESWARDKKTIKVEEQKNTLNAFRDYKAEAMAKANGYADGGLVNAQGIHVDANGNPVQDMQPLPAPQAKPLLVDVPVQKQFQTRPTATQDQISNAIIENNATQAVIGGAENDILKGLIDPHSGSEDLRSNSKKVQDMLGLLTPKIDEKKQERLKKIAAINSVGQALSTAFGSYIGSKGGPILNTASDITPKALADFQHNIEKDDDNKYKTGLLQTQEAIRGMHEVAQNELNNRRANQKVLADAQNMVSKFKLDRYQHNEEYRQKMDELAARNGFEWGKMLKQNEFDVEKAKKAAANQLKIANIHESGADRRAGNKNESNPKVTFSQNGVDDELSENDVIAIANVAIAKKQRDAKYDNIELSYDPEYQQMIKASNNGLYAKELKQFVQRYYPVYGKQAGVLSRNDQAKASTGQPAQFLTPNGQVQTVTLPNQNPSHQPVELKHTNSADPYEKYKRNSSTTDPYEKHGGTTIISEEELKKYGGKIGFDPSSSDPDAKYIVPPNTTTKKYKIEKW